MSDRIGMLTLTALLAAGPVFAASAHAQTTWYVDDDAPNDPGPGDASISDPDEDGSAEHPFDAIQEAINAAVNADEVVVADGTYTGLGNRDLGFRGKAITVRSENGPDNCVIDCQAGPDDWCWAMYFDSESSSTFVGGLTVTNAYCGPGGGIYCGAGASPTIVNCIITGNETVSRGGGICCGGSASPTIIDCTIAGNGAVSSGGGVYCSGTTTIVGCTFSENTAGGAGGLMCSGNVLVADCIFSGNVGSSGVGAISCGGEATIINCVVTGNFGGEHAGGVFCYDETTMANCVISGNAAGYSGAGVYCWGGSPVIRNCMIANNGWSEWGGAVGCVASSPTFENCVMSRNMVIYGAGGLYCRSGSVATLINCVITDSTRLGYSGGGGLYCTGSGVIANNCILWGNAGAGGPEIRLFSSSTLTLAYSDVEGGEAAAQIDDGSTLTWGAGNIDVDPLFVDPDGPDDDPNTWGDNNYRVSGNSLCIDAGDNDAVPMLLSTDLDGRLRFADRIGTVDTGNPGAAGLPIVDMGSYEYQCTGDLDGDGEVDLADLAALLAQYGTTTDAAYADGDLDQDGDVDLTDLATLLAAYGTTCE